MPILQHRKIVQERQAGIGNQPAAAEMMEPGFSLQRLDDAVTGG